MLFEQASQACAHSDQQQDEQRRLEAELCAVAELSRDKDCEGGQRNHQADEGEGFFDLHGFELIEVGNSIVRPEDFVRA